MTPTRRTAPKTLSPQALAKVAGGNGRAQIKNESWVCLTTAAEFQALVRNEK